MKKLIPVLLFSILVSTAFAQKYWGKGIHGKGPIVEKQLDLEDINSFALGIFADVILKKGKQQRILVVGQANIVNNIKTKVKKQSWSIQFEEPVKNCKELTIYITLPEIESISLGGSGTITSEDTFTAENCDISLGGSGDLQLNLDAQSISTSLGGSGTIKLAGQSDELHVSLAGSGDIYALELEVDECHVSIAGSGDVEISVADELQVSCVGSGDVRYRGFPRIEKSSIGSGDVEQVR